VKPSCGTSRRRRGARIRSPSRRAELDDAGADSERTADPDRIRARAVFADPRHHCCRLLGRTAGEQQRELIAADAKSAVQARADRLAYRPAQLLQDEIAGAVPGAIVDLLEVVEVDVDQAQRHRCAPGARPIVLDRFLERAAVPQPGQHVGPRQREHLEVVAVDLAHQRGNQQAAHDLGQPLARFVGQPASLDEVSDQRNGDEEVHPDQPRAPCPRDAASPS